MNAVAEAMFDPFEYLWLRNRDGLLNKDFKQPLGTIVYHVPCHARVQNMGKKTRELLELVPDTEVAMVERCSGHDGTWGVKTSTSPVDENRRPVFGRWQGQTPNYMSSDCPIAARHIRQGMGEDARAGAHPLTLLRMAYGLLRKRDASYHARKPSVTRSLCAGARRIRGEVLEHKRIRTIAIGPKPHAGIRR